MELLLFEMLLVFLTNALVNLTQFLSKNPLVKNLKVLKKIPQQFDSYGTLP